MADACYYALIITAIHLCFEQGMILGWLRIAVANWLDSTFGLKASRYIQKPLWDCMPCMASLWTILISWGIDIKLILAVCGFAFVLEKTFFNDEECGTDTE